jgi:hypothetical protein
MTDISVRLKPLTVPLDHLYLDPNNPRFAKSLNLSKPVADKDVPDNQERVKDLFVNEKDLDSNSDDEESEAEEGRVRIGDLVRSMEEIGFVPIDQVVVRQLDGSPENYVVIEGNRRIRAAKYLCERSIGSADPKKKRDHERVLPTLKNLDVLLLATDGLTQEQIQHQIGVILGLRHYGQVLGWGPLAKAVNIYNEYMSTQPIQTEFALDASRISHVTTLLSESRSGVKNALKTYIAYKQLQNAFPHGQPKPAHYSLLEACVTNRRLGTSGFVEQDGNSFKLSASSLEKLNTLCEFETRDSAAEGSNVLADPKSVGSFAAIAADAASNRDSAVRAFAASLRDEVLAKERSLDDAVDNLRSFKSDRVWTEALEALLDKIIEPDATSSLSPNENKRLVLKDFVPTGNDLLRLEEARKAFKNVRTILGLESRGPTQGA